MAQRVKKLTQIAILWFAVYLTEVRLSCGRESSHVGDLKITLTVPLWDCNLRMCVIAKKTLITFGSDIQILSKL